MTTLDTHLPPNIRPFDVRRDLLPVADLVETCFGDRLSREGEALVRKMRSSARDKRFKRWARRAAGKVSMPLSGFVWENGEEVIGNLSFIPFRTFLRHHYLIANVAVHPHHQRQGIGLSLVKRALQDLDSRKLDGVWLHVEDRNQTAVELYRRVGFQEKARRTTWVLKPPSWKQAPPLTTQKEGSIRIRPRRHWEQQKKWLARTYPRPIRWYFPFEFWYMRGGLLGALAQFLEEKPILKQWSDIQATGELAGVLTWQPYRSYADRLWLAAPPHREELAIETFFPALTSLKRFRKPLRLNYPAGRAVRPLEEVGFTSTRTLLWMRWEG